MGKQKAEVTLQLNPLCLIPEGVQNFYLKAIAIVSENRKHVFDGAELGLEATAKELAARQKTPQFFIGMPLPF